MKNSSLDSFHSHAEAPCPLPYGCDRAAVSLLYHLYDGCSGFPVKLAEVDQSPSASVMKNQVVGLIAAVAYLRAPLIVLNAVVCVTEIVF